MWSNSLKFDWTGKSDRDCAAFTSESSHRQLPAVRAHFLVAHSTANHRHNGFERFDIQQSILEFGERCNGIVDARPLANQMTFSIISDDGHNHNVHRHFNSIPID